MKELLIVTVFLICQHTVKVSGIHCFDCNSLHDSRCTDPFKNSTALATVNCDLKIHPIDVELKSTFCRKVIQKSNRNEIVFCEILIMLDFSQRRDTYYQIMRLLEGNNRPK